MSSEKDNQKNQKLPRKMFMEQLGSARGVLRKFYGEICFAM